MTKGKEAKIRLIDSEDCTVGDWVHNTTPDCPLHGYWHLCIGVRVGENRTCIWLEMDGFEDTDLYHVDSDDTIVVSDIDPRSK